MSDYISREAVMDAMTTCYWLDTARKRIERIPAADVVPVRHGRWISDSPGKRFGNTVRLDEDGCPVEACHCSECGEWLSASDEYQVKGRFCPSCGAIMDKDGDGDG